MHFGSGFISVKIGWNILNFLNIQNSSSKITILILILFFGIGISGFFEIVEYTLDVLFSKNTQPGGLKDTMQDMIDALVGGLIMSGYFFRKIKNYKKDGGFFKKLIFSNALYTLLMFNGVMYMIIKGMMLPVKSALDIEKIIANVIAKIEKGITQNKDY